MVIRWFYPVSVKSEIAVLENILWSVIYGLFKQMKIRDVLIRGLSFKLTGDRILD